VRPAHTHAAWGMPGTKETKNFIRALPRSSMPAANTTHRSPHARVLARWRAGLPLAINFDQQEVISLLPPLPAGSRLQVSCWRMGGKNLHIYTTMKKIYAQLWGAPAAPSLNHTAGSRLQVSCWRMGGLAHANV